MTLELVVNLLLRVTPFT